MLRDYNLEYIREVNTKLEVTLVTDYSGAGGAEIGLACVRRAMLRNGLQAFDIQVLRAGDVDSSCRAILLNHPGELCPQHVFGDMLERLKPGVVSSLRVWLQEAVAACQQACAESPAHAKAVKKKYGRDFVTRVVEHLKGLDDEDWEMSTHCYRCGKKWFMVFICCTQ